MKKIELSKGSYALVDNEDFKELSKLKWFHVTYKTKNNYAVTSAGKPRKDRKYEYMHRIIMRPPKGMDIDHIDGDGLNNQKSNLRICTRSENIRNSKKRENTTSRYKGVCFKENRWVASIYYDGKHHSLGRFKKELPAARAYDLAAAKHFGEFARLNFPKCGENLKETSLK